MKLALVPHQGRPAALEVAVRLINGATARGMHVVAAPEDATLLGIDAADLDAVGIDLVVGVGGDGTVLSAAQVALRAQVPVFGVNVGRVGFLAEVEPEMVEAALDAVASGDWSISQRMTVAAVLETGTTATGINDILVEKVKGQRIVGLRVAVDGEPFLRYRADGLLVATPTGSTAYSFSSGGPLVAPTLEAMILTPVAAHSLFSRSVVFPPEVTLRCTVDEARPVSVHVDGVGLGELGPGQWVDIRRGSAQVQFLELTGRSYAATVKRKFRLDDG